MKKLTLWDRECDIIKTLIKNHLKGRLCELYIESGEDMVPIYVKVNNVAFMTFEDCSMRYIFNIDVVGWINDKAHISCSLPEEGEYPTITDGAFCISDYKKLELKDLIETLSIFQQT